MSAPTRLPEVIFGIPVEPVLASYVLVSVTAVTVMGLAEMLKSLLMKFTV